MADHFHTLDVFNATATDLTLTDDLVVSDDATITDALTVTGSLTVAGNAIIGANTPTVAADRGFKAWTMPVFVATTGAALSPAGTMHIARIRRVPAGTITNIIVYINVAGSSLTSGQCFAALFTAEGALVGQTADQSAAWAGTGLKTMALSSPYVNAAGDYYAGFWYNGTTGPTFARPASVNTALTNAGLSAPNFEMATADTGLTTTAPSSIGSQTGLASYYWAALS